MIFKFVRAIYDRFCSIAIYSTAIYSTAMFFGLLSISASNLWSAHAAFSDPPEESVILESPIIADRDALTTKTLIPLQNQYADAKLVWKNEPKVKVTEVVEGLYEMRPGLVRATIASNGKPNRTEDWSFHAYKPAWIAKRRIRPGDTLSREDFQIEEVDLTEPLIHEVRGLIVPASTDLGTLEARVTILEGQFPITSGVQKIPAVKKGEVVRLILRSGELELSVSGVVQEPSHVGNTLRVLTSTTKREVSGILREGKIVEVSL